MTWSPASLVARDNAVQRLIDAHPQEYHQLLAEAEGELPGEPCDSCAYLGADALQLAVLLGHDRQGHQVHRALWAGQILSVPELLRVLDGDVGLHYLHGQGLGEGGLERIHDRVTRLERHRGRRRGADGLQGAIGASRSPGPGRVRRTSGAAS
ncbi:hypothetical protein R1T08_00715 [Streptomyces sp. SBC-4]|nr:hypothetical protein [Streptomyces sp. SBC-4]MDV5142884.1 hypothetical protein [Streptomyces sp. SBC-4]